MVLFVALIGPAFAPHSITATVGPPGQGPSSAAWLGTDYLGRDVLSRLLGGGRTVIAYALAATALAYCVGVLVGLVAGYSRSIIDAVLMRGADVLLAFPALLILLVLAAGLGQHMGVVVAGAAIVQAPAIARVMRTVTLEASTRGYVDAAVARGERSGAILRREILPNVTPVLLADFGLRFGYAIVLIASINFLALGLNPPAADWGLMMSENRSYVALNPWAVVAPAIMLALLTISVNMIADAYVRTLGRSSIGTRRPRTRGVPMSDAVSEVTSHIGGAT